MRKKNNTKPNLTKLQLVFLVYSIALMVSVYYLVMYRESIKSMFYTLHELYIGDLGKNAIVFSETARYTPGLLTSGRVVSPNGDNGKYNTDKKIYKFGIKEGIAPPADRNFIVSIAEGIGGIDNTTHSVRNATPKPGSLVAGLSVSSLRLKPIIARNDAQSEDVNSTSESVENEPAALFAENTLQRSTSAINTDVAPSGDPDSGTSIPIGDNWVLLLLMGACYTLYKLYRLKFITFKG